MEPALGWAYTGFLGLNEEPGHERRRAGKLIVESYIQEDQRIVDNQARAEFLRQGSPMERAVRLFGSVTTADQLAHRWAGHHPDRGRPVKPCRVMNSLNDLAFALQGQPASVAQARSYAQSFTSIFGSNVPPSYIDLGNFVQLLRQERAATRL